MTDSIVAYLNARWDTEPSPGGAPGALLRDDISARITSISSGQLTGDDVTFDDTLTLWLYRVSVNPQLRSTSRTAQNRSTSLPVDLHYLLTSWSQTADNEQRLMGWALRTLDDLAVLDASLLSPDGMWRPDEVVHVQPEELTNEDMLRLWDSLQPNYRLSYSYVARVIVLESTRVVEVGAPVLAKRIRLTDEEP